jgi:hypothetical protein
MPGDRDDFDAEADSLLDQQIRQHFASARASAAAPDFESVLAKAAAADAVAAPDAAMSWLERLVDGFRLQPLWTGAVAATLALAAILLVDPETGPDAPNPTNLTAHLPVSASTLDGELLASLSRETRWEAPSDRWLAMNMNVDVYGLPEIGSSEILKE